MVTSYILFPKDRPTRAQAGGKAFSLWQARDEFEIPAWFVITPQAFSSQHTLLPAARLQLESALETLPGKMFAVRSSAVDEDGELHSFAGQLQSFLNVSATSVAEKAALVHASAFSDSVLAYRQSRGVTPTPEAPAVLVQQMVAADAAGVAFSVDPLNPSNNRLSISAVSGLADKLVSGEIVGDSYQVNRDGAIHSQNLQADTALLSAAQIKQLATLTIKAQEHFGCPQDVEWAFAGPTLYLLQSRPITTLPRDNERLLWDNANIVESYSGITSPLTFSFARRVYREVYISFSSLMGVSSKQIAAHASSFDNMLGYIHGHIYYNLLNWYQVLALFPGFALNKGFMEQMMGVQEALSAEQVKRITASNRRGFNKLLAALRVTQSFLRLKVNALILPFRIRRFYARLDRVLASQAKPLDTCSLIELANHYHALERELLSRWQTPIINDFLCMISFGFSRSLLKRYCGDTRGQALHNDYMIGQGDIISAEPAKRIKEMAELVRGDAELVTLLLAGDAEALKRNPQLGEKFSKYLLRFGDRCTEELKLESLTLHEQPKSILQAIGRMAERAIEPNKPTSSNVTEELRTHFSRMPIRGLFVRLALQWAKSRIRDRENLRFQRTRVFAEVRRIFRAIGKQLTTAGILNDERDIFFLQLDEVLGIVEGSITTYNIKELVRIRRSDELSYQERAELPSRFQTTGAVLPYLKHTTLCQAELSGSEDSRQGVGCCRGVVRAAVCVVRDPRNNSLQRGEILVAKHTDPGWIALFGSAAGILVERGSLLSHSAIVAREMGIPAIVAVPGVLNWLQTGDIVEMNGETGVIRKVSDE